MHTLAIDIGNTYIKVGVFKESYLAEVHSRLNTNTLTDLLKNTSFQTAIISSITPLPDKITKILTQAHRVIFVDATTQLPFTNLYATPKTLGADRIAAVTGASFLYPERNVLAIDIGTCITYDFIDKGKRYHGGSISPGLQMRLRAMHTFTARLPLISTEEVSLDQVALTGKSTREALLSGAIYGTGAEITEMIRMYANKFADLQVVVCGGDAPYLTKVIRQQHVIIPELVLIGLNRILIHNVS